MKVFSFRHVASVGGLVLALLSTSTGALAAHFFAPESGKGPAVLLMSGAGGITAYRWYAMDVAKLGYTTVLVDARDMAATQDGAAQRLIKEIADLQADRRVMPGKVAVIGFSQGGGGAVVHATLLPDQVSAVVAYYPALTRVADLEAVGKRIRVPTLVLAGEKDKYLNCCLIESMRRVEAAAAAAGTPMELFVYPDADHAFNLEGPRYRPDDSGSAWDRTKAHLAKLHPLH